MPFSTAIPWYYWKGPVQPGTAGQVLTSNGGTSAPSFQPASGGGGGTFASSVSANVPTGSTDNYSPSGYTAGTTNRLILTPASGGSTLDGLVNPATDGFVLMIFNASLTAYLYFANLASGTAANQFNVPNPFNASSWPQLALGPQGAQKLTWINGNGWTFC